MSALNRTLNRIFLLFSFFPFTTSKLSQNTKEHFGPGGVFAVPALKPSNSTKHCFECGTSFSLFKQKHHCFNCGNVVCHNCSDHKRPLLKFGYENPVRCCTTCDKLNCIQNMNSNELSKLSPKALKEYINAYNLPSKNAIEKSDLVRIIFNTRPISNDSESYYRRHRSKQPPLNSSTSSSIHSGDENTGNPFSFTNILHEIFTPPVAPTSPRTHQRQQQQEQQQRQQQQQHEQARQRQQQEQARQQQQQQEQQRRHQQEQVRQQQEIRRQQQQRDEQQQRIREQQQRQAVPPQRTTTPPNTTSPQRPLSPLSSDNLLSLHDLVKTKIDPASLSVRTLKSILKANYVEQSHVIEKSELVKLVVRLADQHKAEIESNKRNDEGSGGNEDLLCRICFDKQQNCVFLDCGHMVTCMDCAKKLIESRNECPICREPILKLVHVFRS